MPNTERERELLAVTLQLLQEHGYDRLTMDEVAATAHASKATVYRRWPTKAELVLAAVTQGMSQVAVAPETGNLREDLLQIGEAIANQARANAATMRAVLVETSHNPALRAVMQHQFDERKKLITTVLHQAVERGEISAEAIDDELWDLLPGYLVFRAVIQNRPATRRTVAALVDDVILPGLRR